MNESSSRHSILNSQYYKYFMSYCILYYIVLLYILIYCIFSHFAVQTDRFGWVVLCHMDNGIETLHRTDWPVARLVALV